jgi:uncharacterized membrane protein YdjX (TVP38/TMEM64 family)
MSEHRAWTRWQTWLVVGLVVAILIAPLLIWGRHLYALVQNQQRIRAWVEGFGLWGPAAIVILEFGQTLMAPIPGQAIEAVSGYLFGPWLGTLYAMIGIATGSLLNFALARRFGRPLMARLAGARRLARLDDLAERGGSLFFFLLWLFPLVPDDLACLASGLTPMPTRQFLLLMIVGRFPGIFVATLLGTHAAKISPTWWIVSIGFLTLSALALWRWGEQVQAAMLHLLQRLSDQINP